MLGRNSNPLELGKKLLYISTTKTSWGQAVQAKLSLNNYSLAIIISRNNPNICDDKQKSLP